MEVVSTLFRSGLRALPLLVALNLFASDSPPVPRFSVKHMDRSVSPSDDFFRFACGAWLKNNPVPPDKSGWGSFWELQERNWFLLHEILESSAAATAEADAATRQLGDFFASALDTHRLEEAGFRPIEEGLRKVAQITDLDGVFRFVADRHRRDVGPLHWPGFDGTLFGAFVAEDQKDSSIYAFYLGQGGLGMPDRDYYLSDDFSKQRQAYREHITRMLVMLGDPNDAAQKEAGVILDLETKLAKAGKSRVDLRDPVANYHRFATKELVSRYDRLPMASYLDAMGLNRIDWLVVGQPEFFAALNDMAKDQPLEAWKTYLRWHLVRKAAPFLHAAAENESFAFYGTVLEGKPAQEPRWQRAARVIDSSLGECLGRIYVERHFPPAARARMKELVGNLKEVFAERLQRVAWMTDVTRAKAMAKFNRFTAEIGHPDKFRDYSGVDVKRGDYFGNVERAALFESQHQVARVGKPVEPDDWAMTPPTVNAYFHPMRNQIVFPAGVLQPPFFDVEMDDAVNYGAIGMVIGHEITHGYDDEGRKYDEHGTLNDWWTEADSKAFEERAQKLVDQYDAYSPLPGEHVNGRLTLGENIADLGGLSIAYEALQHALDKDPSKRKTIEGFTPEQRFFLSATQLWRSNYREAEIKRRLTIDPHSPPQFRGIGPHVNLPEFYAAFGIKEGAKMWRAPELRAKIW